MQITIRTCHLPTNIFQYQLYNTLSKEDANLNINIYAKVCMTQGPFFLHQLLISIKQIINQRKFYHRHPQFISITIVKYIYIAQHALVYFFYLSLHAHLISNSKCLHCNRNIRHNLIQVYIQELHASAINLILMCIHQ